MYICIKSNSKEDNTFVGKKILIQIDGNLLQ